MTTYQYPFKIITPFSLKQKYELPFYALHRYESETFALEISYGDHNFTFETYLYSCRHQRYKLNDIFRAAGENHIQVKPAKLCVTQDILQKEIIRTAAIWKTYQSLITQPSDCLLKIAAEIKAARKHEKALQAYQEKLEAASLKAARAFIKKDYKAVIYWLRPYQHDLDKSDLKKLWIAKKRFLQFL